MHLVWMCAIYNFVFFVESLHVFRKFSNKPVKLMIGQNFEWVRNEYKN